MYSRRVLYYLKGCLFVAVTGNKICEMLDSRLSKHTPEDGLFPFSVVCCHFCKKTYVLC